MQQEDEYEPESPIPEVEEDLPTDESTNYDDSPRKNVNLKQRPVKPDDTIVLELGGGPPRNKSNLGVYYVLRYYLCLFTKTEFCFRYLFDWMFDKV